MSLSIGIVGLPNVGKSTLFNALTNNNILAANYPFATIEPNTGIVPVPDERLNVLAKMYHAEKITPATVTFVDIAGLVAGASKGEGLGNKFLANIRQCDAIVHIVRAFESGDIVHVENNIDPKRDIDTINTELILADLQTLETRLTRLAKEAKANPKASTIKNRLEVLAEKLRAGTPINEISGVDPDDIADLHLLTAKPTSMKKPWLAKTRNRACAISCHTLAAYLSAPSLRTRLKALTPAIQSNSYKVTTCQKPD